MKHSFSIKVSKYYDFEIETDKEEKGDDLFDRAVTKAQVMVLGDGANTVIHELIDNETGVQKDL